MPGTQVVEIEPPTKYLAYLSASGQVGGVVETERPPSMLVIPKEAWNALTLRDRVWYAYVAEEADLDLGDLLMRYAYTEAVSANGQLNVVSNALMCGLLEIGNSLTVAARVVGVAKSDFGEWLDRGEQGEYGYRQFAQNVYRAMAQAERIVTSRLIDAGKFEHNWKANALWLERRRHADWQERRFMRTEEEKTEKTTVDVRVQIVLPHNGRDELGGSYRVLEAEELPALTDEGEDE